MVEKIRRPWHQMLVSGRNGDLSLHRPTVLFAGEHSAHFLEDHACYPLVGDCLQAQDIAAQAALSRQAGQ
jgi:hypothetical protein